MPREERPRRVLDTPPPLPAGAWQPEEAHELFAAGEATAPCGRGLLWLGAPRAHRLARPERGGGVFVGQTFSLAPEVVPPPAQLRRIIEAGGGAVLEQGAPLSVGAIAVVPDGAGKAGITPNRIIGRLVGLPQQLVALSQPPPPPPPPPPPLAAPLRKPAAYVHVLELVRAPRVGSRASTSGAVPVSAMREERPSRKSARKSFARPSDGAESDGAESDGEQKPPPAKRHRKRS